MREALLSLDLSARLALFVVQQALVYYWTRYVVAPARPGVPRAIRVAFSVPLVFSGALLFHPSAPDEFALTLYSTTNCIWICLSKLCALCSNRGQLVKSYETRNNAAFAFGLLFPVIIAFHEIPTAKKDAATNGAVEHGTTYKDVRFTVVQLPWTDRVWTTLKLLTGIVIKNAVLVLIAEGIDWAIATGRLFWRDVGYGYFLYLASSIVEDGIATVAILVFNVKTGPHFNFPWLSQSVTELWSKRYNLPVAQALRDSVYDPIYEGRWMHGEYYLNKPKRSVWRRLAAVIATFFLSGWFHSLLATIAFGVDFPLRHGSFFVVISMVVVLEVTLKTLSKKWCPLGRIAKWTPSLVWMLYTHAAMLYLGHVFYWPDAIAYGVTDNLVYAFTASFRGE